MPDVEPIDPGSIADSTGLTVEEVQDVLAHLVPGWIFSRHIEGDMNDLDYLDRR